MHINFSELLVILLVALLVIKPERLPEVAKTLGRWLKAFRSLTAKLKDEVEQPLAKYSFNYKHPSSVSRIKNMREPPSPTRGEGTY